MSTTAITSNYPTAIMPQEKSPRQIVRQEIKRAKELEALQAKYEAGEISKFEYAVNKAAIEMVYNSDFPNNLPSRACVCNCVA